MIIYLRCVLRLDQERVGRDGFPAALVTSRWPASGRVGELFLRCPLAQKSRPLVARRQIESSFHQPLFIIIAIALAIVIPITYSLTALASALSSQETDPRSSTRSYSPSAGTIPNRVSIEPSSPPDRTQLPTRSPELRGSVPPLEAAITHRPARYILPRS
ncbi:hypothetical protein ABW21_db0207387 [Orbilia brochopaga]|nr:hypothetical protein ABW21_db0207387 [Drechslerella brochopaga]